VFRIVEYGPGVAPRNHRTESIDYAVVIAGEIDGATVPLRQGDVLVQRGTIHNWNNHGTAVRHRLCAYRRGAGRVLSAIG
jgi:hypothetical protein